MPRLSRHLRIGSAVLLSTALLASCGGQVASSGDKAATGSSAPGASTGPIDAANCPEDASEPLADGAPIKIGVTIAQSGPVSILNTITDGAKAYFAKINADGGIDGHKVELVVKDDAFDPARASTNIKELVQKDKVLAVFNQVGTSGIKAAQPFVEQTCTSQIWTSTGDHEVAADPAEHPWTTAQLVPYDKEAELWVKAIERDKPDARVALLTVENDAGAVYTEAVKKAVEGTDMELVSVQSADPTAPSLDSQITAILAAKPDAVLGAPNNQDCPSLLSGLAQGGFTGQVILTSTCNSIAQHFEPAGKAADGAEVLVAYEDPGNPTVADSPEVTQYLADMKEFNPSADPLLGYTAQGYNLAALLVANLTDAAAGDDGLSRVGVMNAVWSTDTKLPLGLPGVTARLDGANDPFLFNDLQLMAYDAAAQKLTPVGDLLTYK